MLKHPKSLCVVSLFCASALFIACNKPESEKPEPEKPDKNLPQIVIDVQGNINVSLEGGGKYTLFYRQSCRWRKSVRQCGS